MGIYESGEDYLETILMLRKEKGMVRSVDVAAKLGYSKPSVSRAMHILKDAELINMDESGHITLTASGSALAEKVYERHLVLTEYLTRILGVSEDVAKEDACKIEHDLSEETYGKIKELVKSKL